MPTRLSYEPGTPCWVDLTTPDPQGSTAFYGALFGWEAEEQFDEQDTHIYTNFRREGQLVAGMAPQQPEMSGTPPYWSTYIASDDVDTVAKTVEQAGGTVMLPPMDVMAEGRMAVFSDPTGAVFGVWQAGRHFGAEVCNEPNAWSWNELVTDDVDAALDFYGVVFGWTYQGMPIPDGTYHVIQGGDSGGLGGLMAKPEGMPAEAPSYWAVYVTVADITATMDRARELGGQAVFGPVESPGVGILGAISDPQGGVLSIMQPVPRTP